MRTLDAIFDIARTSNKRIVLSEGEDNRIIAAALRATEEGIAQIALVGNADVISQKLAGKPAAERIEVHDPQTSELIARYADEYFELRKHKGVTEEKARAAVISPLGFAAMMVRQGDADGTIGGAVATTADTVRAAMQIIGKTPDTNVVSSFFLMLLGAPHDRPVVFADCALIIEPSAPQLADIAKASAKSFTGLTSEEARVAMLSFSTHGSAKDTSIDRINEALELIKSNAPDLRVDGEIQFDAAFVPDVASRKAPDSPLQGAANVFVFPSLSAGNIGYKIAQRIGGAIALGPVMQGLAHPANDLSRGCSTEDVYQMIAITAAQAAAQ